MHDPIDPVADHRSRFHALLSDRRRLALAIVTMIAIAVVGYYALQPRPGLSPPGAGPGGTNADGTGSSGSSNPTGVSTPSRQTNNGYSATTRADTPLVVHVAGAVVHPGVVTVPAGSRVVDAIDAVGGATRRADPNQLDLATKLVDGMRIYVPKMGEVPNAGTGTGVGITGGGIAAGSGSGPSPSAPINLNTATQGELETLPGIGPSLAKEILAERDRLGGYSTIDDLGRVHGIGARRLAQLKPLVTV